MSALGALRALAEAGKDCYASAGTDSLVAKSRWYRPAPGLGDFVENDATPDSIHQLGLNRAVLMPCSDSTALAVARLRAQGSNGLLACTSDKDTLLLFQDKQNFAKLLTELSVPHPFTVVIDNEDDFNVLGSAGFSNAFLKPADSQSFTGHFGVKAFWVDGKDSAIKQWRSAHENGFSTVLQEYVPGDASEHCFIDGFVDRTGRICGQFARRRLRIHPPDFGNSTLMVSIPLADMQQAAESMATLLQATGYRGIYSAEFKRDARTGEFKLLEVNTRVWWYVDFARRCGIDVCNMAYNDALGRSVTAVTKYAEGRRCVYPHRDFAAYLLARKSAPVSLMKWIRPWFGAMQPVFRLTDPMPATRAAAETLFRFVRQRIAP